MEKWRIEFSGNSFGGFDLSLRLRAILGYLPARQGRVANFDFPEPYLAWFTGSCIAFRTHRPCVVPSSVRTKESVTVPVPPW